jgi:hypothetical protein
MSGMVHGTIAECCFTVRLPEPWSSTFSGNHAVLEALERRSVS